MGAPICRTKEEELQTVKAGKSKNVDFTLTQTDLSIMDNAGKPILLPGKILISVGGCQPDKKTIASKKRCRDFYSSFIKRKSQNRDLLYN